MDRTRDAVTKWVLDSRSEWFPEMTDSEWSKTQWFDFLQRLGSKAPKSPDIEDDDLHWKYLRPVEQFVWSLRYAVSGPEFDGRKRVWSHTPIDMKAVKKGTQTNLNKLGVEDAVSEYLDLPVRSQRVDRCLVDMLIYSEFAAFASEVFTGFGAVGWRRGNGPIGWVLWRLASAILLVGPAVLISTLSDSDWANWVAVILVGLFLLESAFSLIMMPFAWRAQVQHNSHSTRLLKAMNGVYSELNSNGPISARHIREVAQSATKEGVVWPSALFVLLDDIVARDGRL